MITTTQEAKQAWLEGRREEVREWCEAVDPGERDIDHLKRRIASRVAGVALELLYDGIGSGDYGSLEAFLRYIRRKA